LKKHNFRKLKRDASPSEQVDSISIFEFEEEKQNDNLQQDQEMPLHQEEST
jgi:hypothetical protein